MRRRPHRIACLLAAASLALPAAAWGQSAGDEQYEDPFEPETGQTEDEGPSQAEPAPDEAPAAAPEPQAAAPAQTAPAQNAPASSAQQLPRTGADAGLLALGGTLLLAGGIALRVRLSELPQRRRGRAGRA
jgi:LPXTG-motif cell wall-anchored protein